MKIPKSLKLPRKLKKEVKKGFVLNGHNSPMRFSSNPFETSVSSFFNYTYLGSNTKSFFRLCKVMRKEEKRTMKILLDETLKNIKLKARKPLWNTCQHKMYESYMTTFDPAIGDSKSAMFIGQYVRIHLRNTEIHGIIPFHNYLNSCNNPK